tara:strand:- start:472 stop:645 length:174 start_codon:yes stop_codon:yes gene_type:complete
MQRKLWVWRLMSFIKNTKEYDEKFILPDSLLENVPKVEFVDQSKDFKDDDCGDSCTL